MKVSKGVQLCAADANNYSYEVMKRLCKTDGTNYADQTSDMSIFRWANANAISHVRSSNI